PQNGSVTISYLGIPYGFTANYYGGSGASLVLTYSPATTTTLGSTSATSVYGQTVVFTATVAAAVGADGLPGGGLVNFSVDGLYQATVPLFGQSAYLALSTLTIGSHTIGAAYGGSSPYLGSTAVSISQSVVAAGTTTSVSSDFSPSQAGQAVTFWANVTAN